jgi:tetratricopeptide (TPR) repeat protein
MNLPLYIAKRFLKGERGSKDQPKRASKPAIRVATFGVAIGIAVMIISISVVGGYKKEIGKKITGFTSHIEILSPRTLYAPDAAPLTVDSNLTKGIGNIANVKRIARVSEKIGILKTIDAIKCFIELCISGRFAKLKEYNNLPKEDQALYHLANGDVSLALALLENLMDTEIDKANVSNSEEKRQRLYSDISSYACCFGALSEMSDVMLATSAYELAIELKSTNVVAWSRLGDVYKTANSTSKAVWAYQNVLNFADGEIDVTEIANANKHLSEHLYAEGNSLQAAKLYNSSKQYYDSLGINRRLDKQEIEIIEIIESNHQNSLPEMIQKLLGSVQNDN